MSSHGVCPEQMPPSLATTERMSIASCYYSTLDNNVSFPVMRADSIAQIAKALARLVLVVSPPFVTLNFIEEWSKTVCSQKLPCDANAGLWCSDVVA